jgi:hypothetical protein
MSDPMLPYDPEEWIIDSCWVIARQLRDDGTFHHSSVLAY